MVSGEMTVVRAEATRGSVLVVDDDQELLKAVGRLLERGGFVAECVLDVKSAEAALRSDRAFDAILTDLYLDHESGLDVMALGHECRPHLQVVVMTGHGTIAGAVEAMRMGAFDFVTKPVPSVEELRAIVQRAVEHSRLLERNRYLESRLDIADRFAGIVAQSRAMRETLQLVDSVAATASTVLIRGESGTGKEVVAKAIHERSTRANKAFIGVNCGALTESVLESELFGHVRGAFTGAVQNRRGLFEQASGGTIFLDEIGELSPQMQVRLLRVLEEGEIRPVGESESRKVDVRVLAATHQDLEHLIENGGFRTDLYYRLNVIAVFVAPLRERQEDIMPLAHHFVLKHAGRINKAVDGIDVPAVDALERYDWPGNVRELSNAIERAVALLRGSTIDLGVLPPEVRAAGELGGHRKKPSHALEPIQPWADARERFELDYFSRVLAEAKGNLSLAAEVSGTDRSNLKRMLKRHGLSADDYREANGGGRLVGHSTKDA
jgi:DNA-binding NtrC family response regulator